MGNKSKEQLATERAEKAAKVAKAKMAAASAIKAVLDGQAAVQELENRSTAAVKDLIDAAGQSGPFAFTFADGSARTVVFRAARDGSGYTTHDWTPPAAL